MWLHKLEIEASEDEAMEVLMAVKRFGLTHKRLLTEAEFETLAKQTLAARTAK